MMLVLRMAVQNITSHLVCNYGCLCDGSQIGLAVAVLRLARGESRLAISSETGLVVGA